jgi:hypothetical protein
MPTRVLGLSVRMAILVVFAIFFVAPILWLVLAPTKSDHALILDSRSRSGELPSGGSGLETWTTSATTSTGIGSSTRSSTRHGDRITLVVSLRVRPRLEQIPTRKLISRSADLDDHPGRRARAPDLPRDERGHLHRGLQPAYT